MDKMFVDFMPACRLNWGNYTFWNWILVQQQLVTLPWVEYISILHRRPYYHNYSRTCVGVSKVYLIFSFVRCYRNVLRSCEHHQWAQGCLQWSQQQEVREGKIPGKRWIRSLLRTGWYGHQGGVRAGKIVPKSLLVKSHQKWWRLKYIVAFHMLTL